MRNHLDELVVGGSLGANLAGMGIFLLEPGSLSGGVLLTVGVLGLVGQEFGRRRGARISFARRARPFCALGAVAALFTLVALRHQLTPWAAAPVLVVALLALSWNALATARASWSRA